MPVIASRFRPAWWLRGDHAQTLWPALFRRRPPLDVAWERLELEDGDFLDLAWYGPDNAPVVLFLHGLEGSLRSHYAGGIMQALAEAGRRTCLMHFRNCGREPNRLPISYHSGKTDDPQRVLEHIAATHGQPPVGAVGISLGGNVLLKWLGEQRDASPLRRCVAVSVPFRLEDAARRRAKLLRHYKIQEVIKRRQVLLIQVVKEERGNKGAALTTYLSLAGRYCVLMPNTARGGGISRKITNAADRKKLKEIASEIEVPKGAGLIIRTAGAQRTKAEIKRDYEYLQRLWEQIRELTLKSIAPAKIYEEGDLIKRSIRDLYNKDIDEILGETVTNDPARVKAQAARIRRLVGSQGMQCLFRLGGEFAAVDGIEDRLHVGAGAGADEVIGVRLHDLSDDLAMALKSGSTRVVAPIPGKDTVGIEVPNSSREMVRFKEVVASPVFAKSKSRQTI